MKQRLFSPSPQPSPVKGEGAYSLVLAERELAGQPSPVKGEGAYSPPPSRDQPAGRRTAKGWSQRDGRSPQRGWGRGGLLPSPLAGEGLGERGVRTNKIPRTLRGFTLIELIIVIAILGLLAALTLPRFTSRTGYDLRRSHDQVRAALRMAQKTAIAQRKRVLVTTTSSGLSACYTNTGSCTAANNGCSGGTVPGPDGTSLSLTLPTGISLSPATTFTFDGLGCASAAQTLTLSGGSDSQTLSIEAETGYVH